ncbi:MAG TPA: hypothetical protein VEA99_08280 [Gemmatimonadaceae bacterium]|nr:hypothetical protein [Gemmatimonadaceae bacterium]
MWTGTHLTITDEPRRKPGAVVLARGLEPVACTWSDAVGSEVGEGALVLRSSDPKLAHALIHNVVRIADMGPDGVVRHYEFRIVGEGERTGSGHVLFRLTPAAHYDLGRVRVRVSMGGVASSTFSFLGLTAEAIIDAYVLPALAAEGWTHYVKGTVPDTVPLYFSITRPTCLSLLVQLAAELSGEFWTEDSGTAYSINLGKRNAAAAVPTIEVGVNADAMERDLDANDQMANRIEPFGEVADGEATPTHIGQHSWEIAGVTNSGRDVALVDPETGANPVGFDDEYNGMRLVAPLDPVSLRPPTTTAIASVAFDPTTGRLWCCDGTELWMIDLVVATPGVPGARTTVTLGGGASGPMQVVYSAELGAMFVLLSSGHVSRYTLAGAHSATTALATASPARLSVCTNGGFNRVLVGYSSSAAAEVFTASTLASEGVLAVLSLSHFVYDGTYLIGVRGHGNTWGFYRYTPVGAPGTWASVNQTGAVATQNVGWDGTRAWVQAGDSTFIAYTPSTNSTTSTTLAARDGIALVGLVGTHHRDPVLVGTYLYWPCQNYVHVLDTGAPATQPVSPAWGSGLTAYQANARALWLVSGPLARPLWLDTVTGEPRAAVEATIEDTIEAGGGSGVVRLASGITSPLAAGMRAEIRLDAARAYLQRLTDPLAVATYGVVDGEATHRVTMKANYAQRSAFLDEWTADGFPARIHTERASRWSRADRPAGVTSSYAATASYVGGASTVDLTGLPVGRVISRGDIIAVMSGANISAVYLVARSRVVADGSGTATVTVTPNASAIAGAVAIYPYLGATFTDDVLVSTPTSTAPTVGVANRGAITGEVVLPFITGATRAHVTLRLVRRCLGAAGAYTLTLTTPDGVASTPVQVVEPFATADGLHREFTVSAIATLVRTTGAIRWALTATPAPGGVDRGPLYLIGLVVSIGEQPIDARHVAASDANAVVHLTHERLRQVAAPVPSYRVRVREQATPLLAGGWARLKHAARGVNSQVRILRVTRTLSRPGEDRARPEVELDNNPESFLQNVLALDT